MRKWLWLAILLFSCSEGFDNSESENFWDSMDFLEVENSPGDSFLPAFDRNFLVSDVFYEDSTSITSSDIQHFLENSPYQNRSWLADEWVGGTRASELIHRAASRHGINPMLLLVRLQVEQGLVSRTTRPTQARIDRALGCGCHDGSSCASVFRGFQSQMECGAEAHRRLFAASKSGGAWSKDKARRTLDPLSVTPRSHATAALYAYTPWVLQGRGGNWLVWNIGRRYLQHVERLGISTLPDLPWIGQACELDVDCVYGAPAAEGLCFRYRDDSGELRGFCSMDCAGTCPDRRDSATTFCVELEVGQGRCVSKSESVNNDCAELPGTRVEWLPRFVGDSGVAASHALVCAPDYL